MLAADRVEQMVPYLRRYARAATGDTQIGDACVERVLQSLLIQAMDGDFDAPASSREVVFRHLEQELDQLAGTREAKARRALLLIAVESFPERLACHVLDVSMDELADLVAMAERDFAASTATSMLIIEDEPLISAQLKRLSEGLGHKVIGIAATADRAVELQQQGQPDIVLCDIHLADGSLGTDAIARMQLSDQVPVVFITAYPEEYLSTLNAGPSYLITKPFDPEYIKAVIGHALINVQDA